MDASKKDNVPNYYAVNTSYLRLAISAYSIPNYCLNFASFLLTIIIIFTTFTLTIIIVKDIVIIYLGCK